MPRPSGSRSIELRYGYSGLWFGAIVLLLLGGSFVVPGINLTVSPPPQVPGKDGPGAGAGAILLAAGLVFLFCGGLLVWLAQRWSGRFEADPKGIRWWSGGKLQRKMRWADVRRIHLPDAGGWLVLEGPEGTEPLEVSTVYNGFGEFLERLQSWVDWDELTRPDVKRERQLLEAEARAAGVSSEAFELPRVIQRVLGFRLAVAGVVLFAAAAVFAWQLQPGQAPPGADAKAQREQRKDEVAVNVMRFGFPFLCLLSAWGVFSTWTRFTVDEDGIEFRYFLRSRRYGWREVRSVEVHTKKASRTGLHVHVLVIGLRGEGQVMLPFGELSFAFRDLIAAAGKKAGVRLRSR